MKRIVMTKSNKGSSMITVLVVVTILMTIVLSVLQISYRYYISENGSLYTQKCKEAAQSFSEEVKQEMCAYFETYDEQADKASMLWKYVRYNMCTPNWKYEAEEAPKIQNNSEDEYYKVYPVADMLKASSDDMKLVRKEFEITLDDEKIIGDADTVKLIKEEMPVIHLTLYWQPGKFKNCLNESKLYAETVCTMGDYSYSITNVFTLGGTKYPCNSGDELDKIAVGEGQEIYQYHRWKWVYAYKF